MRTLNHCGLRSRCVQSSCVCSVLEFYKVSLELFAPSSKLSVWKLRPHLLILQGYTFFQSAPQSDGCTSKRAHQDQIYRPALNQKKWDLDLETSLTQPVDVSQLPSETAVVCTERAHSLGSETREASLFKLDLTGWNTCSQDPNLELVAFCYITCSWRELFIFFCWSFHFLTVLPRIWFWYLHLKINSNPIIWHVSPWKWKWSRSVVSDSLRPRGL